MKVFIDLENTIIKDWNNPIIINHTFFHRFFENLQKKFNINEVSIFSFAIDTNVDRVFFMKHIASVIETVFDIKIGDVPTMTEIYSASVNRNSFVMDLFEFKSLWGKTRAFHDWVLNSGAVDHFILVDDVVLPEVTFKIDDDFSSIAVIETFKPIEGFDCEAHQLPTIPRIIRE